MAGRPLGRKNIRSYLAAEELNRLQIKPIERALEELERLEALYQMNVEAYKSGRGYGEKSDAGTQYLANAIRCVMDRKDTYMTLAKFIHPTLSAVAIKDMTDLSDSRIPMTTEEAIKVIQSDPFHPRPIEDSAVIDAMYSGNSTSVLPISRKEKE